MYVGAFVCVYGHMCLCVCKIIYICYGQCMKLVNVLHCLIWSVNVLHCLTPPGNVIQWLKKPGIVIHFLKSCLFFSHFDWNWFSSFSTSIQLWQREVYCIIISTMSCSISDTMIRLIVHILYWCHFDSMLFLTICVGDRKIIVSLFLTIISWLIKQ